MTIWEGLLLGLVQGLTEFLPVSSSGHLVLAHHALGLEEPSLFTEVMLHAGTLLAITMVFWKDLYGLGFAGLDGALKILGGRGRESWGMDPAFRLLVFLLLATLPVAVVGLLFKDHVESIGMYPGVVGIILLGNGLLLLGSRKVNPGQVSLTEITLRAVLFVGLAQTLALLPGISRSGTTIIAALVVGVQREGAGRLSFLLAVPAILGATVLEGIHVLEAGSGGESWSAVLAGTVVATVSGYAALRLLLRLVRRGRLHLFAPYCLVLGAGAVVVSLI